MSKGMMIIIPFLIFFGMKIGGCVAKKTLKALA